MPASTGRTISSHTRRLDLRRHERARRERAHASGIRPAVVVEDPLVILRGRQAARSSSRRRGRSTTLPARRETLRARSGRPRRRTGDRPSSRAPTASAVGRSSAMTTPLPAARPSAFMTSGYANSPRRIASSAAAAESQTRNAAVGTRCRAMKSFAKALLHSRAAAALVGPTIARPAAVKASTTPRLKGSSGPTTVRSTLLTLRNRQQLRGCGDVGGQTARDRCDPGVSRRADDSRDIGLARQFPRKRVLARAAPDDEDFHGFRLTDCLVMSCAGNSAPADGHGT